VPEIKPAKKRAKEKQDAASPDATGGAAM